MAVMASSDDDDIREERARRLLAGGKISNAGDIDDLLSLNHPTVLPLLASALRHRRARVRAKAADSLRRFGEPGFEALVNALQSGPARQKQAAAEALGNWGEPRAVPCLLEALTKAQKEAEGTLFQNILLCLLFQYGMLIFWVASSLVKGASGTVTSGDLRMTIIEALGKLDDVRAIPPLVRIAAGFQVHSKFTRCAQESLLHLLPHVWELAPQQADLLGQQGIPSLISLLSHRNALLVEDALDALRAVGDGRAIPAVKKLAKRQDTYLAEKANLLLPVLEERARSEQERLTLLRGSATPQTNQPSSELLRAASAYTTSQPPEQLLRAALAPEESLNRMQAEERIP